MGKESNKKQLENLWFESKHWFLYGAPELFPLHFVLFQKRSRTHEYDIPTDDEIQDGANLRDALTNFFQERFSLSKFEYFLKGHEVEHTEWHVYPTENTFWHGKVYVSDINSKLLKLEDITTLARKHIKIYLRKLKK